MTRQAPPISLEFSHTSTVTIQTIPSITSEMTSINEQDPLLPDSKDTPLIIPCNTFSNESSTLLTKSSSYDNVSNNICDLSRSIH